MESENDNKGVEEINQFTELLKKADEAWDERNCTFVWPNNIGLISPILAQSEPVIQRINAVEGADAEMKRDRMGDLLRLLAVRCWKGQAWKHHSIPILECALGVRLKPSKIKMIYSDIMDMSKANQQQEINEQGEKIKASLAQKGIKRILSTILICLVVYYSFGFIVGFINAVFIHKAHKEL
jgi:hypothetical protein